MFVLIKCLGCTGALSLVSSSAASGICFLVQMSNNYTTVFVSLMEKGPVRLDVLEILNLQLKGGEIPYGCGEMSQREFKWY